MSKKPTAAGLMPNGNFVKYDTQETPGLPERPTPADQEITVYAGPQKSKSVYMQTPPEAEPIKVFTPEELRQIEAAKLFTTLTKAGHSPRNARRFVLKKLKVRINPNL